MHIVIIGSGIIGLTSAWYIKKAGHEVSVIDALSGPAMETSFANGGLLSVGQSAPSGKPGLVKSVFKEFFNKNSPLKVKPDFTLHQISWLFQMLKECNTKSYNINLQRMINMANFTRECFYKLKEEIDVEFDYQKGGILQLCENEEQMKASKSQAKKLEKFNIKTKILSKDELLKVEPGLKNSKKTFIGALHFVNEESGDCHKFAKGLEKKLVNLGVKFHYGVTVKDIVVNDDKVEKLIAQDNTTFTADAYVVATGAKTYNLLKNIVKVPVYPVKGYSLTLPVTHEENAIKHAAMDMSKMVAMARFTDRVVVAGYGEVMGFDDSIQNGHVEFLKDAFRSWFSNSVDFNKPNAWIGFRPMTPDGTPIISKTPKSNLYVNTGHGTYGWTMSCGSGQLLIDIIDNKKTKINTHDYSLDRYK